MELNENPPNPNTMGILQPIAEDQSWFVCFEYQDVGHVTDDDRKSIDAAALLAITSPSPSPAAGAASASGRGGDSRSSTPSSTSSPRPLRSCAHSRR